LLLLVAGSAPAFAQEVSDPAEAEVPVVAPRVDDADEAAREESERAEEPTQPAEPTRAEPTLEERRVYQLRQLEARLSVGQTLTDEERRLLGLVAVRGETPRARALAAAILPWLPPEEAVPSLLSAADDEDARVRDQALLGLT